MNQETKPVQRVIGFDCHPDSFTAAVLRGPTPAAAIVEKIFNKVPIDQLQSWTKKHTLPEDVIALESSGNSFEVARQFQSVQRQAKVLESFQMGKLKEAHANNDKISAVRIGKAYLAGTAKEVWVPDPKTQERRDWFHIHSKATKRTTQLRNRLQSYLSDNGVRLPGILAVQEAESREELREQIGKARTWPARQWQVVEGILMEIGHAEEQKKHWRSLIAQEVLSDPLLVSIVRLCGVREMVAFALGAFIGDIKRFSSPKKLVKYFGLNPAFDDSGEGEWSGGIAGHGRSDVRALLIEAAHSILRSTRSDLGKWGRKLLRRKGEIKLVVAAVARKLTVAVWYLMMGHWTPLEEVDARLKLKIGKMIAHVGPKALETLGKTRKDFRHEIEQSLKTGRTYVLDRKKTFKPKNPPPEADGNPSAEQQSSTVIQC